jgi:hypothetical protein
MLGDLLVREGMLTRAQLEDALRAQAAAETPGPLGEILVEQRLITRSQLDFVLDKYHKRSRLGDILVETNAISEEDLKRALEHQTRTGLRLGDALLELELLTERQMKEALCKQVRATFVDLDAIALDGRLAELIPRDYAEQRRLLPIARSAERLTVAMEDPSDLDAVEEIERVAGCPIEVVTSTHVAFARALDRLYAPAEARRTPALADEPTALPALRAERDALRRERDEATRALRQLEQRHAAALRAIRELETIQAETARKLKELMAAHAQLRDTQAAAARALAEQRRQHQAQLRRTQKSDDDFDAVLRQLGPSPSRRPRSS